MVCQTITPARPAHFLFELAAQHSRGKICVILPIPRTYLLLVLEPLGLCIKYRMLRDGKNYILSPNPFV